MRDFKMEKLRDSKLKDQSFKPEDFVTDQVFFKSKDGTKVPMFITRKKSLLPTLDSKPTQPITTLLYGYGGFTVSQTPKFSPTNIVMLKNLNVMYVVASIRGGGEYGE
jgi:prolyl oligopeptidase